MEITVEKLIINVHNTNFEVIVKDSIVYRVIDMLKNRYTTHSYLYSKSPFKGARPKLTMVPDKMYFSENKKDKSYRFSISVLKDFIILLGQQRIRKEDIVVNKDKDYEIAPLDVNIKNGYTPKDYQYRYIDALLGEKAKKIALIDLIMGYGKAQPLDSGILIPTGWTTMGSIEVGEPIINPDGSIGKVTGKYPQGKKKVYKLTFEDGRTCRTSGEHLWKVYTSEDNEIGCVIDTHRLMELMYRPEGSSRIFIDLIVPHEYLPDIIVNESLYDVGTKFAKGELEVFKDEYHRCSLKQRIEILQGLFFNKKWNFNFNEIVVRVENIKVAELIVALSRSIGDIAEFTLNAALNYDFEEYSPVVRIYTSKPYCYFIKDDTTDYDLKINTYLKEMLQLEDFKIENFEEDPIRLELKKVKIDSYEETCCISVDHQDQLYITDNFVVTHNTFISVFTIVKLNMRTLIIILPKYIDKWINDLKEYTDVDIKNDVYIVKGGDSLIDLMSKDEIPYKFIICSMRTVSNYIKEFEDGSTLYPVRPENFIRKLKVGVILNDETHQEFHALFKASLYFDPPKLIGMTATIETKDTVMDRMYKTLFPPDVRISNLVEYIRYVDVKATAYTMDSTRGIKCRRPAGYNHVLFEQTLMRNKLALREYIGMIVYYIELDFIRRRKVGERAIIFAATVDFCSILTNHLKSRYPNLDVRRYVEDDPLENILVADLTCSTVISAGTAIDVKKLIYVLQTICISSMQSNLQAFGRLRDLEGSEKVFRYFYSRNIPDQYRLHIDRRAALYKLSKTYEHEEYPHILRVK